MITSGFRAPTGSVPGLASICFCPASVMIETSWARAAHTSTAPASTERMANRNRRGAKRRLMDSMMCHANPIAPSMVGAANHPAAVAGDRSVDRTVDGANQLRIVRLLRGDPRTDRIRFHPCGVVRLERVFCFDRCAAQPCLVIAAPQDGRHAGLRIGHPGDWEIGRHADDRTAFD